MAIICEMFMNGSKNRGICKKENKQISLLNKEYIRDDRCVRKNIAYKFGIFHAVNLTLHGHYTHVCTVFKVTGMNTEKICAKQGINNRSFMIKNKYRCEVHSTYA